MKPTRPFHQTPVITIDGPTASGKGTVAALVAATLGFHLLDSGALYRLTALASMRYNIDAADAEALAKLIGALHITFREGCAQLDGVDVSADIRAEPVGNRASAIAVHPEVRKALIARQRGVPQGSRPRRGRPRHEHGDLPGRDAQGLPDGKRRGPRGQTA